MMPSNRLPYVECAKPEQLPNRPLPVRPLRFAHSRPGSCRTDNGVGVQSLETNLALVGRESDLTPWPCATALFVGFAITGEVI